MKRLLLLLVVSLALHLSSNAAMAQPLKIGENLRHEQVLLPALTPDRSQLVATDSFVFLDSDGGAGILVFYDDSGTARSVDYIEFYDIDGNLLLVSWVDRRGLCQVAMDAGLLDP
ncbi:MAG: hypothetical protein ACM3SP_02625, partial [Chloroflexota bacterium]